ncbi:hypothetical protein M3P21_16115 [Ruegeria sp. 2012CJ41-6]|uniref:Uncharacterized protein n=1 Tax=Ruegeria spongiae TaxID=2942209 RepID=A0ABT0Q7C3_9RHOB|nr:hypothetical protein [Ruegeria spongiae]MCL6285058.1 hypothetical protein [Ruegeria spongiae]
MVARAGRGVRGGDARLASDKPPIRTRRSEWSEEFWHLKAEADPDGRRLQAKVMQAFLGL